MNNNAFISLPYPPSKNTMYCPVRIKNSQRLVLTEKGRKYKKNAFLLARQQCEHRFKGSVYVSIDMHRPDRRVRDIDNILKIVLDCLSSSEIIEDDRHIDVLLVNKRHSIDKDNARVDIEITNLTDFKI